MSRPSTAPISTRFRSEEADAEELRELRKRYLLLEGDRRAFEETSEATLKANREFIATLKHDNKKLKTQVLDLQRQRGNTESAAGARAKLADRLEQDVSSLRSKLDRIEDDARVSQDRVEKQSGLLDDITGTCNDLVDERNPLSVAIRDLENQLDQAVCNYNEALTIRKTYREILGKLREERVGYDFKIEEMEAQAKTKRHDTVDLDRMQEEARKAMLVAKAELDEFVAKVTLEAEVRRQKLSEREALVSQHRQMQKRLEAEEEGSPEKPSDEADNESSQERLSPGSQNGQAMRKIKDATGVSQPNEIIEKFLTQDETHRSLQEMSEENERTKDQLEQVNKRLRQKAELMRYGGGPLSEESETMMTNFEQFLSDAQQGYRAAKERSDAARQTYVALRVAVDALLDKLAMHQIPGIEGATNELGTDGLAIVEGAVVRIMEGLGGEEALQD